MNICRAVQAIAKVFLINFILSLGFITEALCVDQKNTDIVEMYPDEAPKLNIICERKGNFFDFLEENEFYQFSPFIYLEENYKNSNHVFMKLDENEKFSKALFIKYQNRKTKSPSLKKEHFYINEGVFRKDKWNIPRPITFYQGKKGEATVLSWRYIDFILHSFPGVETDEEYREECTYTENLFCSIKEKGLQHSIIRLLCVEVDDEEKSFIYNAYDTHEEYENSINNLTFLK